MATPPRRYSFCGAMRALRLWLRLFLGESVRAIVRNSMRSALAVLGVTIGIAAVVCVMAVGEAGSALARDQLQQLGDNLVWVEAGSRNSAGVRTGSHNVTTLTAEDAAAILREVPRIKSVSPQVDGSVLLANGNRNWKTRFRGVAPAYIDIKRFRVGQGSFFTDVDVEHQESVCVLGQTVRAKLFGEDEAVGAIVRLPVGSCTVVGVLAPKGQSASGQDQDDVMMLPYTTAMTKLRGGGLAWLDDILCSARSPEDVEPAVRDIRLLMRDRHHIAADGDEDFNLRRPDEIINAQIEASRSLSVLLTSVALISLLVGGIGIMNVMLVSVTQRTREIGVRLAIGARRSHVRIQFMGESVVLTFFGGVAGVLLGMLGCQLLGRALSWAVSPPVAALLMAPTFSVVVGIVFGSYPAIRAARLDPIEALRTE